MSEAIACDICVIGAGAAGLTVAAGASQLGASTVLVEHRKMGGDCLNYGCVPSKALLAAARVAATCRGADRFGISVGEPAVDFAATMRHVHAVIAAIAPTDSVARFEGLGVRVLHATARFAGPREIVAGDARVTARRFVIAAGAGPAVPPIPGLDRVPYLTNETLFDNGELPRHLVIIGGGPIGIEMAQAHARLGARVTVIEAARALAKDDPELAEQLLQRLRREGIAIREGTVVARVHPLPEGIALDLGGEPPERLTASHLLVATGRRPDLAALDLDKAGIAHEAGGITVDERLRTTNRRVFAIGDVVAGAPQFTHIAGYHAGIVIRNALFRLPAKVDYRALPWVTYTDPELAHVGLTEADARARYGRDLAILRSAFHENDRAQTERATAGGIKVVARRNGRILGASILGAHAGELIQPWGLAIAQGLRLKALAGMIAPYPTFAEANKRAAASFYMAKLFSERTRRLVRLLARFG
ncbi:MAG TPA: FAD-dependent oxidoreductase [Stellaceae bacterium]|nr:FAD-dependent oxidoreductase [Stellaceae bacterium]